MSFYTPKKPVKSFLDLEVYQKSLEASVFVAKQVMSELNRPRAELDTKLSRSSRKGQKKGQRKKSAKGQALENCGSNIGSGTVIDVNGMIARNMLPCALGIPHLIAEAHSLRFGTQQEAIVILEKVMVNCNKMVVYLEQVRDICETGIEWEDFDEQIKKYLYIRRKVLNLQRVWKKFMEQKKEEMKNSNP